MAVKRKKSQPKGTPAWMVTMGDMNNLLMCFFIIMMGDVTTVPKEEFLMTLSSFRGALGLMTGGMTLSKGRLTDLGHNIMSLPATERKTKMAKMRQKATEVLKAEISSKKVRVAEEERGLVISLPSDLFFDPASAKLKPQAREVLDKLGKLFTGIDNFIRIEGHTDSNPITLPTGGEKYETNWELSSARSINVLRYLSEEDNVNPKLLSAVAFGQYRPIDDNSIPEGRAYNRRVDIVILTEKFLQESTNKDIYRPFPDEEWQK